MNKHDDNPPPPPSTQCTGKRARAKARRKSLQGIPVEIVQAKTRNLANPYSYLTPKERAERLAKLWREMFQHVETPNADPAKDESP